MASEAPASNGTAGERNAIGISFGNSNSSIAYTTIEDKAEVIANEDGDRQIPSILSYIHGDEYYGQQAKQQLVRNSANTVAYFRDFLGQDFKSIDPTHCHASAHPLDHEGTIAFKIQDKEEGEPSTVSVSEVATRVIRRLAQSASDFSGKKINSAVITVPTNFSDSQKAALTKSANDAGLEVLQLISEPVAALLAYDARPESKVTDKNVIVADLGGTRSDVAVIASRGGMYTILATAHDYEFAGVHLDKVLMDHFSKEFIKWNSIDPRENARSLAKLKLEAEATKKALSIGTNSNFSVESLAEGIDFSSTINRLRYETIGRKVFDGFNRLIESVVKKAGLDALEIDDSMPPSTSPTAINPSELQARGAALQASLIQEFDASDIEQSTHAAVTTVQHLTNAIGVLSISGESDKGIATPKEGGDVLVKIVEGGSHIKVTKPEPKPKSNGAKVEDANSDDSEEDDSEEEEEEQRERIWKVGNVLAEAAVKGVKKGGKVEVMINISKDFVSYRNCT
ncbi:hypothetical protein EYC84_002203 [Monilinia fructicola]|uniref:Uncharacterized protein n=1 Tax=Monilinia fructicola TaxID=38448 RepID=A0A5M9JMH1_MONFR|nr:hypothetical protein EYC84_002203 [Monilinia fructicola]